MRVVRGGTFMPNALIIVVAGMQATHAAESRHSHESVKANWGVPQEEYRVSVFVGESASAQDVTQGQSLMAHWSYRISLQSSHADRYKFTVSDAEFVTNDEQRVTGEKIPNAVQLFEKEINATELVVPREVDGHLSRIGHWGGTGGFAGRLLVEPLCARLPDSEEPDVGHSWELNLLDHNTVEGVSAWAVFRGRVAAPPVVPDSIIEDKEINKIVYFRTFRGRTELKEVWIDWDTKQVVAARIWFDRPASGWRSQPARIPNREGAGKARARGLDMTEEGRVLRRMVIVAAE